MGTMFTKKSLLGCALLLVSSFSFAQSLQFTSIRTGGVGCPVDVTSIATAPDLSSASIIFDRFEARVPLQMPNGGMRSVIDVPCNIFVEMDLPSGHKIEEMEVTYDLRGQTFLDPGVAGSFRSFMMSIAGNSVPRSRAPRSVVEKTWNNTYVEQSDDFYVQHVQKIPVLSNCSNGRDKVAMHLQHHVEAKILNQADVFSREGFIIVDSSDISGGVRLKARISRCTLGGNGNGNGNGNGGRTCRTVIVRGRPVQSCTEN